MLKIIVSHDVDHLYPSDHIFNDLIFPKLWVRSFFQLIYGDIGILTFYNRLISIFENQLTRIPELVEFDIQNNIPSIFFFGMNSKLGMSYKKTTAIPWIKFVAEKGLDVGVHGAEIENIKEIQK
jgi:hypothetical protein